MKLLLRALDRNRTLPAVGLFLAPLFPLLVAAVAAWGQS
jgi:hypothetical protein